jgi:hypothetical protein
MNKKMILPIFILMAFFFGACAMEVDLGIDQGSGKVITETREVQNFDRLVLKGIGDVEVTQGDHDSLEIEAEDNVISHITTEVKNGTLEIGFNRKTIIPTKSIKFHLTMRNIRGMETQGVSNITSEKIDTDDLELGISGTGNIDIEDLTTKSVSINVSGAGNLTTSGQTDSQKIVLSGAGNYDGEDLQSKTAEITIAGLGKVVVWATDTLNVTISGTGGVDYYGNPQISQQISGLGRLNHKGKK